MMQLAIGQDDAKEKMLVLVLVKIWFAADLKADQASAQIT